MLQNQLFISKFWTSSCSTCISAHSIHGIIWGQQCCAWTDYHTISYYHLICT
uniref:Uncharacterized protein n=1 Tax=Arundo donax TaxID=35708 RepID=A0A0A9BZ65_ARUDO